MNVPRPIQLTAAVIGLLLLASALAAVLQHRDGRSVTGDSIDAGFARDMSFHHSQAVQMGSYALGHAPTDEVRALASSIAVDQQIEIGQMLGWLQAWGLPRMSTQPAMSWMSDNQGEHHHGGGANAMPGMASPAEMDALVNLTGRRLEIRFLQLMIRHHHGGLPMALDAAEHASLTYVRELAEQMLTAQREEIDRMRQLLSERGGRELATP